MAMVKEPQVVSLEPGSVHSSEIQLIFYLQKYCKTLKTGISLIILALTACCSALFLFMDHTWECWETHESPSFLFSLPLHNKSVWQVVVFNGLSDSLYFATCLESSVFSLVFSLSLFIFFSPLSYLAFSLHLLSLAPRCPLSFLSSVESLCFSTRSSQAPSASERQRLWREGSFPPMFCSSLFPHWWLHTCSHLESGEICTHTLMQTFFAMQC